MLSFNTSTFKPATKRQATRKKNHVCFYLSTGGLKLPSNCQYTVKYEKKKKKFNHPKQKETKI